jgi:hypothetical protein
VQVQLLPVLLGQRGERFGVTGRNCFDDAGRGLVRSTNFSQLKPRVTLFGSRVTLPVTPNQSYSGWREGAEVL